MYFKFHYRGNAMHALAYSFYARKLDLSAFLVDMFKRIPFEWKGSVTKLERLSRGLATGTSMKHGTIKHSWVDILLQIKSDPNESLSDTLKAHVFNYCTEHANEILDWKNTKLYVTRLDVLALRALENFAKNEDITGSAFPETWFRDNSALLLNTKRTSNGCTPQEQHAAVAWMLGLLRNTAKSEGREWPSSLPLVQRKVASAKKFAHGISLAKRFVQGMNATGDYTYTDFLDRFATGEFDNTIQCTNIPEQAGKFWYWVKEARSRTNQEEAAQEAASALQEAEAAAQEATANMTGASEEHHEGWLMSAQNAYSTILQSQWTAAVASIKEVLMEAEEKISHINEKRIQAMVIFTASKCNDLEPKYPFAANIWTRSQNPFICRKHC